AVYLRRLVLTGRHDPLPVRGERRVPDQTPRGQAFGSGRVDTDQVGIAFQLGHQLPIGRVPYPGRIVPAGRHHPLPARRERCAPFACIYAPPAWSPLAGTTRWPSVVNAASQTPSEWPSRFATTCPLAAFHTRAVWSKLAVTTRWPSGENAAS